ncbi:glycosyltransferase family 4 protein [Rudanella lutea]|uniref:glycosyltransferase family 4 protein n=1 Tax=Rudanella lutea TaxID=451374 RepID=UPI00036B1DD7|nr:glycosyltransferase family 4 protein [Rudanella lutea]
MHILLIHPYFLPEDSAGSGRWNETVRYWTAAGHRVTVLAGSVHYLSGKTFARADDTEQTGQGLHVIRVRMSRWYNRGRMGRLWAYATFFGASLWAGLWRVPGPVDLILATSPPLTVGLTGWLLSRLYRKPLVLELRDLWPDAPVQLGYLHHPLAKKLAYALEAFLYRKATHIVTLTTAFEEVLIGQKGAPRANLSTVTNGADLALTERVLQTVDRRDFRQKQRLEGYFWIIYAGAHGPANGLAVVLDAAEALHLHRVGFLLLGDGPEKPSLQAEAARRGLVNVRFLAALPKPEVIRWIAAADAGLVLMRPTPIFDTMLSAKLPDYLACRKPVLVGIDGLSRRLAEQHAFGRYVDPTKPGQWIDAIRLYLESPDSVTSHGNNGYQYVCAQADRRVLAHRYLTILDRVRSLHQTRL